MQLTILNRWIDKMLFFSVNHGPIPMVQLHEIENNSFILYTLLIAVSFMLFEFILLHVFQYNSIAKKMYSGSGQLNNPNYMEALFLKKNVLYRSYHRIPYRITINRGLPLPGFILLPMILLLIAFFRITLTALS
ncbi:hypothetical protein FK004_14695 [Flavobacterium kingsejongi]|uniref:Uncharacterized protein n=1 Tax=Flavobacterium kingsejongi TaxID=1678728 RepID=A0A2S1LRJ3_9FLAO|nr:hypothetical protein FK004_14695 [Flavobacterium kingsejongi]